MKKHDVTITREQAEQIVHILGFGTPAHHGSSERVTVELEVLRDFVTGDVIAFRAIAPANCAHDLSFLERFDWNVARRHGQSE